MGARLKAAFVAVVVGATACVGGLAATTVLAPAAGAYTTQDATFSSLSCNTWVSATAPANAIRAEFEVWGGGGEGGTNGPERNTGGAGGRGGKISGTVPLGDNTRVWALIGCGGSGGTGAGGFADGGNGNGSNSGGGGGATGLCLGTSTGSCGGGEVVAIAGGGGGGGRASDNGGWPCSGGVNGGAGGEGSGGSASTGGTGGENGGNGDGGGAGSIGGGGDGGYGGSGGGGTGEAATGGSAAANGTGGARGTRNTVGVKGNDAPDHPTVPAVSYGTAGKGGNSSTEDGIPGGGGGGGFAGGGGGASGDRSIGACLGSWDGGGGGGAGASWVKSSVTGESFTSAATSGSCSTTNPGLGGGTNGGNGCAGSVTVTWIINGLPTGASQSGLSATKGVGLPITLAASDPDSADGDSATCVIVAAPAKGALTGSGCSRTYTADADTSGTDSFTYRTQDEWGALSSATYTIGLTIVNRAPTGAAKTVNAGRATSFPIGALTATDPDGDTTLTCSVVTAPAKGGLSGVGCGGGTYTVTPGQFGTDTFTYRVADDFGGQSTTYTVTINGIGNGAPTATPQTVAAVAGAPTPITLAGTDPESDLPLTCAPTAPGKGALSGSGCARSYTSTAGTANDAPGGADSFAFTVTDSLGATSSAATVDVTISNPDLALTKVHTGRFNEGTGTGTYTLTVTSAATAPAHGTTTVTDTLPAGMVFRSADTTASGFTCTATPGVSTTVTCTRATTIPVSTSLSFTITVDVAAGASSPVANEAVVSSPYELASTAADNAASDPTDINHRPTAADHAVVTEIDVPVLVTLPAVDPDGDPLTFAIGTEPSSGSLFGSGATRQYVPETGFVGIDTFTYTATDSGDPGLTSATRTVTVYVGVAAVEGVVTDDVSGAPLPGIEVRVIDRTDVEAQVFVGTVHTDAAGGYDIGTLFPNGGAPFATYALRFVDPSNDHLPEWFDGATSSEGATPIVVDTTTAVNVRSVALTPAGRITGTLRSSEVPNPVIEGLQVRLVKVGSPGSAARTSDAAGHYRFELLTAGTYQLWFRDLATGQWISEWYGGAATQAESTVIEVAVGQQVTIDELIDPVAPPPPPDSGSVTGTVTDSVTGAPLAGVQVRLYKEPYTGSAAATTDANGQYSFTRLAPATYKLWFRDMSGTRISEYGGDASTLSEADTLTAANDGHIVNATLAPKAPAPPANSGVVSGTVLELDGFTPIVGLQVRLYPVGGTGSKAVTTGPDGSYSFAGLAPGQYQVWFRDLGRTWFSEWHLDAATQGASTAVAVANTQVTDVDATLNRR